MRRVPKNWFCTALILLLGVGSTWAQEKPSPLFPAPRDANSGIKDLAALLHAASSPVEEDEAERKLQFHDFDPEQLLRQLLRDDAAKGLELVWRKKPRGMPTIQNLKLVLNDGADIAVARFRANGFEIQVVESRILFILVAKHREGEVKPEATKIAGGLPAMLFKLVKEDPFLRLDPPNNLSQALDGRLLNFWDMEGFEIKGREARARANVIWVDNVFALRIVRRFDGATPTMDFGRPLFTSPKSATQATQPEMNPRTGKRL